MGSAETGKLAGDVQGTGPGQAGDKRAEVLAWVGEQEALARNPGYIDVLSDTGFRQALAALRGEIALHEQMPEWRVASDIEAGCVLGCYCCGESERPSWPCPTIVRIHAAIFGEDK